MGTNYYARPDACPTCGRGAELHIGKRSGGWRFNLRAHEDPPIASWADWKRYLSEQRPPIFDEYDRPLTPEAMIDVVEGWRDGTNHFDLYPDGNFLDPDGWCMAYGDFS